MAALDLSGRRAGGVPSLLGRADDAIELKYVVLAQAFAGHSTKVGLVWTSTGDAISSLSADRGRNIKGKQAGKADYPGPTRYGAQTVSPRFILTARRWRWRWRRWSHDIVSS